MVDASAPLVLWRRCTHIVAVHACASILVERGLYPQKTAVEDRRSELPNQGSRRAAGT